jgi:SPOR domain
MGTRRSARAGPVVSTALIALLLVGGGTSPALAAKQAAPARRGRWEVILGHFRTRPAAEAARTQAQSRGYKAVIQPIGPGNVEVEIANGLATRGEATTFCSRARSRGLHCSVEQEFHGIPRDWGR